MTGQKKHSFDKPGTYQITLTAHDNHGVSTAEERTITVKDRPRKDGQNGYEWAW